MYVGTTAVAINRSSASLALTGVSIDGNAGTVTNGVYTSTTSLPNVTSVNSTTIPASSTLLTTASTTSALTSFGTDPTANTQAVDNSSTKIATTAFVLGQASATTPVVDGTATIGTSTRYARADHIHPTDTTRAATGQTFFIGTTSTAINRSSASQSLTGVNIDGTAGTITATTLPSVTSVNSTTIPASATLVTSTAYRQSQHTPSGSVDIVPRYQVSGTRAMTSGTMYFTGFTPIADLTLTKITTVITAVTGATSFQYGLFSVSGTTVTCIASTATGTPATGLLELSFGSSQSMTAGSNYAIGFLAVGGTSVTVAGVTVQANLVLQGNGTAGTVLAPLLAAASNSTTLTAMPSAGSTVALGVGNTASFAFARLN
jgi:hypothetical protein